MQHHISGKFQHPCNKTLEIIFHRYKFKDPEEINTFLTPAECIKAKLYGTLIYKVQIFIQYTANVCQHTTASVQIM